jgi:two-component system invasion response regulator UvrY
MQRILVVDDHEVVREGVKKILGDPAGETVFGEASSPNKARDLVRDQEWDVVILDLSLGGRSGLEFLREIKQVNPKLPVVILSMHSE